MKRVFSVCKRRPLDFTIGSAFVLSVAGGAFASFVCDDDNEREEMVFQGMLAGVFIGAFWPTWPFIAAYAILASPVWQKLKKD